MRQPRDDSHSGCPHGLDIRINPSLTQNNCSSRGPAQQGAGTHRKMGDSMAQLSAQPRDTHSVAFSVRLGSRPKKSRRMRISAGTRLLPPTTSTDARLSALTPASASACKMTLGFRVA